MFVMVSTTLRTGEANARLIAAAPELLEACIKMVGRFEQLSQDKSIPVVDELCIMADAIAHATNGKHPMAHSVYSKSKPTIKLIARAEGRA